MVKAVREVRFLERTRRLHRIGLRSRPASGRVLSAGLLALLAVAGCEPLGVSGSSATRVTVDAGGRPVTIAAPAGFCVDSSSTSVGTRGAFLLLSDCALLGRPAGAPPPVGAALTASVSTKGFGPGGSPATQSLADLERYAASPAGRALLGRSGKPDQVRILAHKTQGDVLYVLVEDRGDRSIAGVDPRFWRAFLDLNGRLTALTELRFGAAPYDPQVSLALLAGFVAATKAANPVTSRPVP